MIDEGELKSRYPEIPWDQPVRLLIPGHTIAWCCRYCVAMHGLRAQDLIHDRHQEHGFRTRAMAVAHIERVHHD